ncbi:MAG: FAD-dependent oxidoreductase [Flavobacteriaceae bacterium]
MDLSYWEHKTWFQSVDFTIVGSGIVGLNCALKLRERFPESKILVLERGILPIGASTKNAGFACFGSLSEILEDLKNHSEEEVYNLVKQRQEGLKVLRKNLGDKEIDYKQHGGYEIFRTEDTSTYNHCLQHIEEVNKLLKPLFKKTVFELVQNSFGFNKTQDNQIYTPFEGQIDTGKMMVALHKKAVQNNIHILNGVSLTQYNENPGKVTIQLKNGFSFNTEKLFIATNGFAKQILDEDVLPARAQVLITKPIKDLKIKGTFHLDQGYYYFRNIDNRIMFGGGRNLDFKTEETTDFGLTSRVQNKLEIYLKEIILPETSHEIEYRWSGIMGVGNKKKPIVKQVSERIFCGIRLGGMGVAIGSNIGNELAGLC